MLLPSSVLPLTLVPLLGLLLWSSPVLLILVLLVPLLVRLRL